MNPTILLTFDVEDWFQVENFKACISYSSWPGCELRVERNVHRILDLLDSIEPNHPINPTNPNNSSNPMNPSNPINPMNSINPSNPKATFFVLGWIAERVPHLVREIQARGHEAASHGYNHQLCKEQSDESLKNDLVMSKKLLEDITGRPIYGYRAPSFSISDPVLELIRQTGYLYDSSFNSFELHGRYGRIKLNRNGGNGILHTISDGFFELPVSNLKLANRNLPWGGGGYFRLYPFQLFKRGVRSILKKHGAYLFYLHPWEIDPDQARVNHVRMSYRLRHYINLSRTFEKLRSFIKTFKDCSFQTCYEYLKPHEAGLGTISNRRPRSDNGSQEE